MNTNQMTQLLIKQYKKMFESRISAGATENLLMRKLQRGLTTWKDNEQKCVE